MLRHEATQLQSQIQRAQQEEAEIRANAERDGVTLEHPLRSEQMRRQLISIDQNIRQVRNSSIIFKIKQKLL